MEGATSTGEYEWEISTATSCGEIVSSQGNYATVTINGSPTATAPLTARILCKTYYMDGNQRKSESAHIDVKWFCPQVAYSIEGNTEVFEGIEETYTGYFQDQNNEATAIFEWSIGDPDGAKIETNPFITSFENKGGQTVTLYCNITAGDIHLLVQKEIHVHTYSMTVKRWDYEGILIDTEYGRVLHHTYFTSIDNELIYVHYNIDDDDESEEAGNQGWDYMQKHFIKDAIDDDLCELEINLQIDDDNFGISDLNESLTIKMPENLRLWSSPKREEGTLLISKGGKKRYLGSKRNEILNNTLYVEGVLLNQTGEIEISFGKIHKKLKYATCSVGNKYDQPSIEQRKAIRKTFENLIDCEWYILRPANETYNCISFSVDPYQAKFGNVSFVNEEQIRNQINIDPKYPYPFWVNPAEYKLIECPLGPDDTNDKFWLCGTGRINLSDLYILRQYSSEQDFNITIDIVTHVVRISGYTSQYKSTILNFLNNIGLNLSFVYLLTTRDFNLSNWLFPMGMTDNAHSFFLSPVWTNENNKKLIECENLNDSNRVVVYYHLFHAARRTLTLLGKEKIEEKDMPSDWKIFASKCGEWYTIIHLENQIEGRLYGQKCKAYKYQGE